MPPGNDMRGMPPRPPGGHGGCPPGNDMRGMPPRPPGERDRARVTPCSAARTTMTGETEIRLTAEGFVERFGKRRAAPGDDPRE